MKLFKSVLILTSVCLTGLNAHAIEAQPSANAASSKPVVEEKPNAEFSGEIEDPPGAMLPPGVSAEAPKPDQKPEQKPSAAQSDSQLQLAPTAPPSSAPMTPPMGPSTRPMQSNLPNWPTHPHMGPDGRGPEFPFVMAKLRAEAMEARMIRIDLKYLMEHACSAQALRLGPATERVSAGVLDERKKNPDKSLFALSLNRPDLEADSYALYYHKSKCLSDFIAKRVGDDFKLNRLKDKTDLKAQLVKKALVDLRDELEVRSLNRGNERCESNALSEQMNCVTKIMVPALEGSMVQGAIDSLLNQSATDLTLGDAKEDQLQKVRTLIAQARVKDAVSVRNNPVSSMGSKSVN